VSDPAKPLDFQTFSIADDPFQDADLGKRSIGELTHDRKGVNGPIPLTPFGDSIMMIYKQWTLLGS
jgi:hypothetical protein